MRPLYVPVRLAATALAVAAAAGCMSVGDDESGGGARPSHSAGERGGEAPGGGPAVSGGNAGYDAAVADDGHGKGKKAKAKGKGKGDGKGKGGGGEGRAGAASEPPAAHPTGAPPPNGGNHGPEPTRTPPAEPTRTAEPEPTRTAEPPASPTPEPTVAEPSSSAHEPPGTQLEQREPAPAAGTPA
ncbi:hypothetical protein KBZ94_35355 [Streptomyces sp. RM72]|uniref:hypothetical protein n=1 Tax=Streptomyces sp. RM72 TaxID=1115510 RepID=UPI001B3947E8|nr:hypothetical protein [Streptomyces sp. RM72]MBQ0890144.1 hypothetical protein [Streptomyces sp. RM72]